MPLSGIRVIDLSQVVAGPYCTLMLADMGAEVVKIERPNHGDDLRRTVPYEGRAGHEDYFNALNRSKKSITLNLKDGNDLATALRLMDRADVVVENFSPGVAGRLGVGWQTAHARNASLVYCSLSGFGQTGPYRSRPALDPIIQAMSGIMSVTGEAEREPMMIGVPLADVISGMFAAYAIVNALRLVTADGGGQYIDLSMQDAMLAAMGIRMGETLQGGTSPGRLGNGNPLRVPANTYRTADGRYISVIAHDEALWPKICRALAREEWIADVRFNSMTLRVRNRVELDALIAQHVAAHDTRYWQQRFEQHGVPVGPVNDYAQALDDPQVAHRELLHEVEHPVSGKIRVVGPPWKMSATPNRMSAPPLLGQHTSEVLQSWLGVKRD
jgi:crotonobetainyl-CoA:carnitine CoA-transferase CaiB-like acyl-CoA transferase